MLRLLKMGHNYLAPAIGHCCAAASVALLLLVPMADAASGSPITLTVDPALLQRRPVEGFFEFDFSFGDQLDGITLSGQSLSLDFIFADDIVARVSRTEGNLDFAVLVMIHTSATSFPGFVDSDATGFLLGRGSDPLHDSLSSDWVGRSAGSDGVTSVGLFPQIRNFEMAGVHYDFTLPTTGFAVTGGLIRLASNSPSSRIRFETARQVPEPSTVLLLFAGLAAMVFRKPRGLFWRS